MSVSIIGLMTVAFLFGLMALLAIVLVRALTRRPATTPGEATTGGSGFMMGILFVIVLLGMLMAPMVFYARSTSRIAATAPVMPRSAHGYTREYAGPSTTIVDSVPPQSDSLIESPQTEIISDMKSVITRLEDLEVDHGAVHILRGVTSMIRTSFDEENAEEHSGSQVAEALPTAPAWANEAPGHGDLRVVISEPKASREKAKSDALEKATTLLMSQYAKENQGVDDWTVDLQSLQVPAVTKTFTEEVAWDFGSDKGEVDISESDLPTANLSFVYRTYLQVNTGSSVKHAMFQQWKQDVSSSRLDELTIVSVGFVGAIAMLALYFRIENRGFMRKSLRFATLVGGLGLGVVSTVASAEGLTTQSHHGPARSQGDQVSVTFDENRYEKTMVETSSQPTANFTSFLLRANRVAFLVLGDHQLVDSGKVDHITTEIAECMDHFGSDVEYLVVGQSQKKFRSIEGRGQISLPALKRTMNEIFKDADSVFPRNSVRNVRGFGADAVVLIRDTKTKSCNGQRVSGQRLAELFGTDTPVYVVEVGREPSRKDLQKLGSRTRGGHAVWDGRSTTCFSTYN